MAKDYARKPRSRSRKKRAEPRVPAWVWLFTGSVLGAFIVFLSTLTKVEDAPKSQIVFNASPQAQTEAPGNTQKQVEELKKPQAPFTFPTMLRDAEVKVPEPSNSGGKSKAIANIEYSLQVASFKEFGDAEQTRAELILLNMEAKIEEATIRNNETWYRVVVGPFTSRSKLSKARSVLISNNYSAQVRKRSIAT